MNIFARIAQMESSRIVGGRAQTQALLRAPDKTSRTVTTGACPPSGSRGVTQYYADNLIPFPSRSILAADAPLECIDLAEARLKEALLFALPVSLFLWGCLALIVWALFF